jgi:predicted Na+-dependent transporter
MTVLVPTLLGQLLRIKLKAAIAPYSKAFSVFSQAIVLLIIFNAVSSSTSKIAGVGAGIIYILLFMIFLHSLVLGLNFGIARLLKLNQPSTAAFTIQTSQKTLTVSYIVWAGYFAAAFPLGLIPAIGYHLTQMVMDTLVAQWFRRKTVDSGQRAVDR